MFLVYKGVPTSLAACVGEAGGYATCITTVQTGSMSSPSVKKDQKLCKKQREMRHGRSFD